MFKAVSPNINFPELEKKILDYWYKEGIVEKYIHRNDKSSKRFSFLDGPITANNPMGVHHAWGRTYKDLWQRFYAMMGYSQRFQNGFDCQGLWIEVEVEKELGIKNKRDIENLVPGDKKASIAKFVQLCKERVGKFSSIQTEQSKRLGYFMDWNNSYFTMSDENNYMIWHFLKVCHQKGWIYKGRDSVPWCPRCETAISQHEMLTEDYKELTHETVFVKLPMISKGWENTYLLIWTTTPWTVPANVAVGVNIKFTYGVWESKKLDQKVIILDKDETGRTPSRLLKNKEMPVPDYIFSGVEGDFQKVKEIKGKDLVDHKYSAPFDHLPRVKKARTENPKKFHTIVDGSEIVVSAEGTGLLHVAPGAGKEDFDLGKKEDLPIISVITDDASYLDDMNEFSSKNAKKHPELIIDFLRSQNGGKYLLKSMFYTHRYPACWRCKTELVWKVADEWYIAMDRSSREASAGKSSNKTLREMMMEVAEKIHWIPDFGLERELDWLKNMHDWLISKKNRYWGLALPIYECKKCGHFEIIGSREELGERAISGWDEFKNKTPHKPYIDDVKIKCAKCSEPVARIDDVGNVWLDAGIVPFSTYTDPKTGKLSYTSDKKYWKDWFPADFITESFPGQFKNWFYSMIAMSTVLENTNPFKSVLGFASVLGEDGRPMHKSWGNAIEFNEGADKIGVDVMRWMFVTHDPDQNILFGYRMADETRRKFHLLLWNVYNFFITYANIDKWTPNNKDNFKTPAHVLDQWILSKLYSVIAGVTNTLEKYDVSTASLLLGDFVTDLSQWYIRRSRDRVGPAVDASDDKNACYSTLYRILMVISKLLAPFIPFVTEEIYRNLTNEVSVHLADWPQREQKAIHTRLEDAMNLVRKIVELGHAARKQCKIKIRQPLSSAAVLLSESSAQLLEKELLRLITDELNIKKLYIRQEYRSKNKTFIEVTEEKNHLKFILETTLTEELIEEGQAREIVRQIQIKRKDAGCRVDQIITITIPTWPQKYTQYIKKETLAADILKGDQFSIVPL